MGLTMPLPARRLRLRVRGTVQGVGFRPFVHGLAQRLHLAGFVLNDGDGVLVEVEGWDVDGFVRAIKEEAPPLARIDALEVAAVAPDGRPGFAILSSETGKVQTRIPADAAICPDCLRDLFDPHSRFHLYPFVTCTHCGPRYTITRGLPYDRPQTSMRTFPLCPACLRDYTDIASRRYHAETLACPVCGPRLDHPVDHILDYLDRGLIVALKGIGGYHLLCDATNEQAVVRLRQRKNRESKPFAVMVADTDAARSIAHVGKAERDMLCHRARPIVLLQSRGKVASSVAPNLTQVGVVLPYAPLHHLLFRSNRDRVLVVTSANPGGEPLVTDDDDARLRLADIADTIVGHDRSIVVRADDSVMTAHRSGPVLVRRARGFVPDAVDLGEDGPAVLALGAHLKTTVTVTRGSEAFVSQHVGSLDNAATIAFYEETVAHLLALTGVRPERVVCDLHPDLYGSRIAGRFGVPVVQVQHHAAHVAAVVAEHRVRGPVLGVALDGHGYGADGGAWGGELILLDEDGWRRVGHLAPLAMPGGDKAAREPWRMALAVYDRLGRLDEGARRFDAFELARLMPRLTMPRTSSMGRVFDAAAALLGVCSVQHYEGQAAMELEALVQTPRILDAGFAITDGVLDLLPLLAALADPDIDRVTGAELFHGTVVRAVSEWVADQAERLGITTVALGGGCMVNRVLADGLAQALTRHGLQGLFSSQVPAGDGGLSLGQAYMGRLPKCV